MTTHSKLPNYSTGPNKRTGRKDSIKVTSVQGDINVQRAFFNEKGTKLHVKIDVFYL